MDVILHFCEILLRSTEDDGDYNKTVGVCDNSEFDLCVCISIDDDDDDDDVD